MNPAQPKPGQAARISWVLYDWASSPLPTLHATFVFAVYFTTVIAPENGSFYWAQMTALSAFLLAFAAPILGRYADSKGLIKQAFIASSVIAAAVTAALWFIQPSSDFILLALILSGLSIFFSEAAFLFYNGLLPLIGSKSEYGRLSGLGWGSGFLDSRPNYVLKHPLRDSPSLRLRDRPKPTTRAYTTLSSSWSITTPAPRKSAPGPPMCCC